MKKILPILDLCAIIMSMLNVALCIIALFHRNVEEAENTFIIAIWTYLYFIKPYHVINIYPKHEDNE